MNRDVTSGSRLQRALVDGAGVLGEARTGTLRFVQSVLDPHHAVMGAELIARAARLADGVQARTRRQDAVLLVMPHGADFAASLVACVRANVIAAPVALSGPQPSQAEAGKCRQVCIDLKPTLVIADALTLQWLRAENLVGNAEVVSVDGLERGVQSEARPLVRAASEQDTALILYTSGSTSESKGIVLSHENVWLQAEGAAHQYAIDSSSRIVTWLSQSHNFGLYLGLLCPLLRGADSTFIAPGAYLKRPALWFEAMARFAATHIGAPNFALDFCSDTVDCHAVARGSMQSVTHFLCAGEPVRWQSFRRFFDKFGPAGARETTFCPLYGLSEGGAVSTQAAGGPAAFATLDRQAFASGRVTAWGGVSVSDAAEPLRIANCGTVYTPGSVRIVSADDGAECAPGRVGEIWLRAPWLSGAYLTPSGRDEAPFTCTLQASGENGFFRTGDLGFLLEGHLHIAGRLKEVLIVRGKNHLPAEIEGTLAAAVDHGALPCVVFGVERNGQEQIAALLEVDGVLPPEVCRQRVGAMRKAVARHHGVTIQEIGLAVRGNVVVPGAGKLKRRLVKESYESGRTDLFWLDIDGEERQASPSPAGQDTTPDTVIALLRERVFAKVLGDRALAFGDDHPFGEVGLDSVQCVRLAGEVEAVFGRPFEATLLFKFQTLREIAHHLAPGASGRRAGPEGESAEIGSGVPDHDDDPIVIVAMHCELPGAAEGPESFWRLLHARGDGVDRIEARRPELAAAIDSYPSVADDERPRWAGLLDDIDAFDASFFGISRREADCMDPQQRKLMEFVWALAERAGRDPLSWARQPVGLFVGVHNIDYVELLARRPDLMAGHGAYIDSGTHASMIPNRVSRWFDFTGPSEVVNTACSSSLVALHRAAESIRRGECHSAIVAGINLILTPRVLMSSANAGMLSPGGRCRTLDEQADGFVRAEGVAGVMLTSLKRATAEGHVILGIVRAAAVNHDGKSNSLRAPNVNAQRDLLVAAYRQGRIDPASVGYIELHGTGTRLGDPIEVQALKDAFQSLSPALTAGRCGLGSAKSNIGHTESAAGLVGVIKVLLAMRHRTLPATHHFDRLNPLIELRNSPFRVMTENEAWEPARDAAGQPLPRRAGVSSFGFGGANAHVVLEEHVAAPPAAASEAARREEVAVVLSAKSKGPLLEQVRRLRAALDSAELADATLLQIAMTLQKGRAALGHRLGVRVASIDELRTRLDQVLDGRSAAELVFEGQGHGVPAANEPSRPADVLADLLARWVQGHPVDWDVLWRGRRVAAVSLPTYPFLKDRHGVPAAIDGPQGLAMPAPHAPIGRLPADAPAATSGPSQTLVPAMVRRLVALFSDVTKTPVDKLDPDEAMERQGLDSIVIAELTDKLLEVFPDLSSTLFFEHKTLASLAGQLAVVHADGCAAWCGEPVAVKIEPRLASDAVEPDAPVWVPEHGDPVAIIGMSGRYPGAETLQAFWNDLARGHNGIGEVPADRWAVDGFYLSDAPEAVAQGKSYSKWGGFIDGVAEFDPLFFHISPREAAAMDPQERLFLQEVWRLFEGAGCTRDVLAQRHQRQVGVYVGAMHQHYDAGVAGVGSIANRVSHVFDLQGPSVAVDTMCSSSAVAIHMACRALAAGECSLAVAGGVNLSIHPKKYVRLSQLRVLGSHPGSRSFEAGDGYLPAEAVGTVLLKPLSRALADGDEVMAVIRGSAVNHTGRSNGYMVPDVAQQARVMQACLDNAGVQAGSVSCIEAAANGSALGDPIEVAALARVFGPSAAQAAEPRVIGSVKWNIGHPEFASGVAQLTKTVLQMKARRLVPSAGHAPLNPDLNLAATPFVLLRETADWLASGPRRALVNSFGAGGTCASLLIEEAPDRQPAATGAAQDSSGAAHVVVVSAHTHAAMMRMASQLLDCVRNEADMSLADLAYTLQMRREAMDVRLALLVGSRDELLVALEALVAGRDVPAGRTQVFRSHAHDDRILFRQLLAGRSGGAFAEKLMADGELGRIALYWCKGAVVPWALLHPASGRRAVALPTYSFERERHWLADAVTARPPVIDGVMPVAVALSAPAPQASSGWMQALAGLLGMAEASLPRDRPLRELGFTSVDAMNLKHLVERSHKREFPLGLIAGGQVTVRELDALISHSADHSGAPEREVDVPVLTPRPGERHRPFPLTDLQQSFLVGRLLGDNGGQVGAHIYMELVPPGAIDVARLHRAWSALVARHDMLRTTFSGDTQCVRSEVRLRQFRMADVRRLPPTEATRRTGAWRAEMSHRIYAPGEWPLFDIRVSLQAERTVIHFSIDELIADGMSVDLLLREWGALYARPDESLPALEMSFRDLVLAQQAFETNERYRRDLSALADRLTALPPGPRLPLAAHGRAGASGDARRVRLEGRLPEARWRPLKAKAAALDVSPTVLLLSLFAQVLAASAESPRFTLLLTLFNRPPVHPQVAQVVGPALSTSLFVVDAVGTGGFESWIQGHQRALWRDLDQASVSAVRVLRELKARHALPGSFTLPVVFTSMIGNAASDQDAHQIGRTDFCVTQTPQVTLDHQVREDEHGLRFSWDVACDAHPEGWMQSLFEAYEALLCGLADGVLSWDAPQVRPLPSRHGGAPGDAAFPLTDQQQAYAFGRMPSGPSTAESCQLYQEFSARHVDVDRLQSAWNDMVQRHPMLRAVIGRDGTQRVSSDVPHYPLRVHDLTPLDADAQDVALLTVREEMVGRVVPLESWPSFEVRVSRLDAARVCVHLSLDLLVADGGSTGLLVSEWLQLGTGGPPLPPPPAVTFRECVLDARDRASASKAAANAHWSRKFEVLPNGPAWARQALAESGRAVSHQRLQCQVTAWPALVSRAALHGVHPMTVVLAAYLEVQFAWNGGEPLAVVVPMWERLQVHPQIDRVVGDFTALCWAARHADGLTFAGRVTALQRELDADLAQRPVSGLAALRRVGRRRALEFPVVFTGECPQPTWPPNVVPGASITKTPQVVLDSMTAPRDGILHCAWDVAVDEGRAAAVRSMFEGNRALLETLAADAGTWAETDLSGIVRARAGGAMPPAAQNLKEGVV